MLVLANTKLVACLPASDLAYASSGSFSLVKLRKGSSYPQESRSFGTPPQARNFSYTNTVKRHQVRQTCKICNKKLLGRSDKIFCSVTCKNYYHTNLRKASSSAAEQINEYLKRNHGILLETLGKNKTQIKTNRTLLEQKKFRFKYHTHFHINSSGKMYHYIYDIAWMEFSDDEILIIKRK